jgi:hypothetical protein
MKLENTKLTGIYPPHQYIIIIFDHLRQPPLLLMQTTATSINWSCLLTLLTWVQKPMQSWVFFAVAQVAPTRRTPSPFW